MKTFLLIVELVSGIALVAAILLHSPKGEGLGGIGGQARIFTPPQKGMEAGLDKITYILAAVFFTVVTVLGIFF